MSNSIDSDKTIYKILKLKKKEKQILIFFFCCLFKTVSGFLTYIYQSTSNDRIHKKKKGKRKKTLSARCHQL